MFLEKSMFSIYRLVLRLPKWFISIILALSIIIAIIQIAYISRVMHIIDVSDSLVDYSLKKFQQRQAIKNLTFSNGSLGNQTVNGQNNSIVLSENDQNFIDDATMLHFRFSDQKNYSITMNYSYDFQKDGLPSFLLLKNQNFLYLKDKKADYYRRHNIQFDLINLSAFQLEQKPLFWYFYQQDLLRNEILLQSMRSSFELMGEKINLYKLAHNQSEFNLKISELYINFYYQSDHTIYPLDINFYQFLLYSMLPSIFVKFIYCCSAIIFSILASIFVGLLVRYMIFLALTIWLTIWDRCAEEGWGWLHQYFTILYQRYRHRSGTLKMLAFYIFSNIGMMCILGLGAYLILTKLLVPSIPLLIERYIFFFLKTMFFIQVFFYFFCRTRITLRFFPIISFCFTFTTLALCGLKKSPCILLYLNLNATFQLITCLFFLFVQKLILYEQGFADSYRPCESKPRMLFYAGYDLTWQSSLPPIWTYFTTLFDYSYFTDHQKCFIEKDYQLLYGRMLGMSDRQEIPEEDYELREEPFLVPEQPSNEINLMR